jgi:NAD-dependent dihydropyrimidine dehydrogenase PreA subunit
MAKVTIDYKKCDVSKVCVDVCPANVFDFKEKKVVVARPQDCIACKACENSCPVHAIKVEE